MNMAGLLMMAISYTVVILLSVYCCYRVLTTPGTSETEHSMLDIDTHDADPSGSGTRLR